MSAEFETVLDECLAQLERGESLDTSLGDDAALADELRPLLAVAAGLRAAPPPRASAQAVADSKQKMLAAFAAQNRRQPAARTVFADFADRIRTFLHLGKDTDAKYVLRFAVGILLVLVFGTSGVLAAASTSSLPGDALYPVKQSVEGLRLSLTLNEQARQTLADLLKAERLREIQKLLALHRQGTVEFDGLLQAQEGNQWTVSGLTLHLSDATTIQGWPALETRVRVLVKVGSDGTLTALRIRLAEPGPNAQGGEFSSPVPVPTGTSTPRVRPSPTSMPDTMTPPKLMPTDRPAYGPMHSGWTGYDDMPGTWQTDHAMATPWPMQGAAATSWPTHDSTSTDHADPTPWPSRSSMMTPQPQHQPMATQPPHQWMPTSQPPHQDDQQSGGGNDWGGGNDPGRRH